jgi:hypothetical protein
MNNVNDPVVRFMLNVKALSSGCWEWTGKRTAEGYGQFERNKAHRWAYKHFIGPIPAGHEAHHTCLNEWCVYPGHIQPLTPEQHRAAHAAIGRIRGPRRGRPPKPIKSNLPSSAHKSLRKSRKVLKTHCRRGHLYDSENTILYKNGYRSCRECAKMTAARRK